MENEILSPEQIEDPFPEPVEIEIRDVFDLHSIPPRQVRAVMTEYLYQARLRGFPCIRIIHGKGIGAQRAMVRAALEQLPWVISFSDAPPEAGGWGATIATLNTTRQTGPAPSGSANTKNT
ncbi:MAG: Smr/MutS family protein [Blastocatellia bacterium]